jgi:hypothetical protein
MIAATAAAAEMSYVFRPGCVRLHAALRRSSLACHKEAPRLHPRINILRSFKTATPAAKRLQDETARETNQRDQDVHEEEVKAGLEAATKQQIKRPWQREGADRPPVDDEARKLNSSMIRGKNQKTMYKKAPPLYRRLTVLPILRQAFNDPDPPAEAHPTTAGRRYA